MVRSRTPDVLSTPDRRAVEDFLAATRPFVCARLNGVLPNAATITEAAASQDSVIIGYAQASTGGDGYTIDCIAEDAAVREQLVAALIEGVPVDDDLTWWGHDLPSDIAFAESHRMPPPHRRLLNMRRPLPIDSAVVATSRDVPVRPFEVGADEEAWLQVNNAAFNWHKEQGNWDLAGLQSRMSEPWFDPAGFLLHERDGRLAAFCWTKMHDKGVGEIHVIAVHPDFYGLGLGRALTIAGLRHLSDTGSTTAMLYVEADNTAAVGLYKSLGFEIAHTDIAFHRPAFHRPTTGDTR